MPLAEVLDPNRKRSAEHPETDLEQLLELVIEESLAIMAHTNLMLCPFRQPRAQKQGSSQMASKLLAVAQAMTLATT
jgi:hypothetical protein